MSRLLLGLVLLMFGCSGAPEGPPEGVLEAEAFIDLMTDIQLLEASSKKRLRREDDEAAISRGQYIAIFEAHGITEAEFQSSHAWWFGHPELLIGIYDGVIEQLNDWERTWTESEGQRPVRDRK
jgi:hypothetical protein